MASAPPGAGSGGMDPITGAALIGGATQLGGAVLGGKGAKRAAREQSRSQDKQLTFAREQDAARRADWMRAMAAYEANRNALLQRYGVSVPSAPAGLTGGGAFGAPQQQYVANEAQPQGGQSLRDILARARY